MTMRSQFLGWMRTLAGATFAALLLAVASLAIGAREARATVGGCFFPLVAAQAFQDLLPEPSEPISLCIQACRRWEQGCRAVVEDNAKCLLETFDTDTDIDDILNCKAVSGPDRRDCKAGVSAESASNRQTVRASRADGLQLCLTSGASCRADCESNNNDE